MSDVPSSAPAPSSTPSTSSAPSTEATGKGQSTSAPQAGSTSSTPPPEAPQRFKFKGKVDGAEQVWEGTESEIVARLQKAAAAEKRMAEAAEIKKAQAEAKERAKKDPWAHLKEMGIEDPDTIAEQRLLEKYRQEMMTEEERKQHEIQKELEQLRAREQERVEQEKQQRQAALEERIWKETERTFTEALAKTGLPGDMRLLQQMAQIAQINLQYGLELTPDQIAAEVKERESQSTQQFQTRVAALDGDALLETLSAPVVEKVRLALLARARAARQPNASASVQPPTPKAQTDNEPTFVRRHQSMRDFRKAMKG